MLRSAARSLPYGRGSDRCENFWQSLYVADLIVEGRVIIELKAAAGLDKMHVAQCLNYLKATSLPVCLLLNFGKPRLEFKRVVGEAAQSQ